MKKFLILVACVLFISSLLLISCKKQETETTAPAVEQAGTAEEAAEESMEQAGEAVEKAAEEVKPALGYGQKPEVAEEKKQ